MFIVQHDYDVYICFYCGQCWWMKESTWSLDSLSGLTRVWESWTRTPSSQAQNSLSWWHALRNRRTERNKKTSYEIRQHTGDLGMRMHYITHNFRVSTIFVKQLILLNSLLVKKSCIMVYTKIWTVNNISNIFSIDNNKKKYLLSTKSD